jgi:uncharacterized protein
MELKQKLESALKDAMRGGDLVSKRTIRMVLANIKTTEIDRGSPMDDASVIAVLQKEIKSRREAVDEARKANRPDLEKDSLDEIKILETFLPASMPAEELQALVLKVIEEVQAKGPADMGKVMKSLLPLVQGKAPNDQVSRIVRQHLSS